MRRLLRNAALAVVVLAPSGMGLAGCALVSPSQSAAANGAQWRTADGRPIGTAEFAMLRRSCELRPGEAPIDPLGTNAGPVAANPAFHPGGAGLMNTTPIGVASSGAPVAVVATPAGVGTVPPLDQCLESKGLVKAP